MMKMTNQVWALKFACTVVSVRRDIEFHECYELAWDYVDNLPNLIREDPHEIAMCWIESEEF